MATVCLIDEVLGVCLCIVLKNLKVYVIKLFNKNPESSNRRFRIKSELFNPVK